MSTIEKNRASRNTLCRQMTAVCGRLSDPGQRAKLQKLRDTLNSSQSASEKAAVYDREINKLLNRIGPLDKNGKPETVALAMERIQQLLDKRDSGEFLLEQGKKPFWKKLLRRDEPSDQKGDETEEKYFDYQLSLREKEEELIQIADKIEEKKRSIVELLKKEIKEALNTAEATAKNRLLQAVKFSTEQFKIADSGIKLLQEQITNYERMLAIASLNDIVELVRNTPLVTSSKSMEVMNKIREGRDIIEEEAEIIKEEYESFLREIDRSNAAQENGELIDIEGPLKATAKIELSVEEAAKAKEEEAAKAEAERQAKAKEEAKAEAERQAKAKEEAKAEAERQAKAKEEEAAKAEAERQAKAKEEEAAKAEAERQAKAEEEAKAEAERQAKAEAEALIEAARREAEAHPQPPAEEARAIAVEEDEHRPNTTTDADA